MTKEKNEISSKKAKWLYYFFNTIIWIVLINMLAGLVEFNQEMVVVWSVIYIGIGFCIYLMYHKTAVYNRFAIEHMNKKPLDSVQISLYILLGILVKFTQQDVWNLLTNYSTTTNDKNIQQSAGLDIPDYITDSMVFPVVEEVVFRGYFFILAYVIAVGIIKLLNKRKSSAIGNKGIFRLAVSIFILSAAIFGIGHNVQSISEFAMYFFSGLTYCVLYILTKRLYITIAVHIINNTMATMSMLYIKGHNYTTWGNVTSYVIGIAVIIAVLVYYPKIKREFNKLMLKVGGGI